MGSGGLPVQTRALTFQEADRLANACKTKEERLIIWTLTDTGLRVSELAKMTADNIQWQRRSIRVKGKTGVCGGGGHRSSSRGGSTGVPSP